MGLDLEVDAVAVPHQRSRLSASNQIPFIVDLQLLQPDGDGGGHIVQGFKKESQQEFRLWFPRMSGDAGIGIGDIRQMLAEPEVPQPPVEQVNQDGNNPGNAGNNANGGPEVPRVEAVADRRPSRQRVEVLEEDREVVMLASRQNQQVMELPAADNLRIYTPIHLAKLCNCFLIDIDATAPDNIEFDSAHLRACKPFIVEDYRVGLIKPEILKELAKFPAVFLVKEEYVTLQSDLKDYETRSVALERVLLEMKRNETFVTLRGWRNECFEVRINPEAPSVLRMERAATCLFGFRQYGVDINGYVMHPTKGLCMWLQKRSYTKQRWAGMWDNMVGGGLAVGLTVYETARKEANEEASVPGAILDDLEAAGTVSIFYESERGLSPNTEFVYDLRLPLDFVPRNTDGEVCEFRLLTAKEAVRYILSSNFKTTSCPVALDFLIRRGIINIENEPELEKVKRLIHIPMTRFYRKMTEESE